LIQAQAELGNRWVKIAKRLSGRTDGAVRMRWNDELSHRGKRKLKSTKEEKGEGEGGKSTYYGKSHV